MHFKLSHYTSVIISLFFFILLPGCNHNKKVWINDWKETSSLSTPRVGAGVVIVNGIIYVIGGVDGKTFLDTTAYAKIQSDGSLGPWQTGPKLNEERGFIGAAVYRDYIYVVGGGKGAYGQDLLRSVERAHIQSDGSLGAWEKEKYQLVIPRRCNEVAVVGNEIYSFGGYGGALLDSVEKAGFLVDGNTGDWSIEKERMTIPRYIHGIQKWENNIYIIGGHDQIKGIGITDVEWSGFDKEGKSYKAWKTTSPLQVGRYGLASAVHNGYIYSLGGLSGPEYLDSIEKSRIDTAGGLSGWQLMPTLLPQTRATFAAVTYKNWIYILGGTNRDGYFSSVYYSTFNDDGDIGFWGTKSEASAYKTRMEERSRKGLELPNEGVAQKVIQVSAYTYIEVRNKDGISWIAGPKTDLRPDTVIRYSKGVYMSNFYSKELQRSFPSILFVSAVKKID
ncbi:MAG: hypothetical protein IT392_09565 [Nitrospirae bacterium]|nr:hypothetical protein [Nitrospirota bacterium]